MDGKGWRRLTLITNGYLKKFRLNFLSCTRHVAAFLSYTKSLPVLLGGDRYYVSIVSPKDGSSTAHTAVINYIISLEI